VRNTAPTPGRRRRRTVKVVAVQAAAASEEPPPWQKLFPDRIQCANPKCPHGEAPGQPKWFTPKGAERACSPECRRATSKASHNKANRKYKATNREEINAKTRSDYAENPEPFKRRSKKYRANNRDKFNKRRRERRAELRGPREMIDCGNPNCPFGRDGRPNKFEKRGNKQFCCRECFLKVWTDNNRGKINKRVNAHRHANKSKFQAKWKAERERNRAKIAEREKARYHVKHPNARYYKPKSTSSDAPSTSP
jgi:hypothetical protein